jgi:UDP-2,3-diacylglucosamine pyrophosphatase LpxH
MKFAIISDMHIGKNARAKDLLPERCSGMPAVDEDYKKHFLEFLEKEHIAADYLLVSGDVSCEAKADEIKIASELIGSIGEKLNAKNIFFVPGNHDKDWDMLRKEGDVEGYYASKVYDALNLPNTIFQNIAKSAKGNLIADPYYCKWENDDIVVLGINTSMHDIPDDKPHHGYVSNESLSAIKSDIGAISNHKYKIVLLHHHPILYSDLLDKVKDFSSLINSENLLNTIEDLHFDLVIHGHKHIPKFCTIQRTKGIPIVFLGAGSFSATLETEYAGHISNQFHIVHIEGRCKESKSIQGFIYSYAYSCINKWNKSQKHNGILHVNPFGCHLHLEELKKIIKKAIVHKFKGAQLIKSSDIIKLDASYKYINNDIFVQAIREICTELKYVVHQIENSNVLHIVRD